MSFYLAGKEAVRNTQDHHIIVYTNHPHGLNPGRESLLTELFPQFAGHLLPEIVPWTFYSSLHVFPYKTRRRLPIFLSGICLRPGPRAAHVEDPLPPPQGSKLLDAVMCHLRSAEDSMLLSTKVLWADHNGVAGLRL